MAFESVIDAGGKEGYVLGSEVVVVELRMDVGLRLRTICVSVICVVYAAMLWIV
jgi:hypothetical protein